MSLPIEALEAQVLSLPSIERARLLDRVVASLDADIAQDLAWDRIAADRDAQIESGASTPVDGKEAIARFINRDELKALQEIGAELRSLEEHLLAKAVTAGEIVEIEHGNYEA